MGQRFLLRRFSFDFRITFAASASRSRVENAASFAAASIVLLRSTSRAAAPGRTAMLRLCRVDGGLELFCPRPRHCQQRQELPAASAVAPGAVAPAPRRAALAAVQPADGTSAHRRLAAGPAVAAMGVAARHPVKVALRVAVPQLPTGHGVGAHGGTPHSPQPCRSTVWCTSTRRWPSLRTCTRVRAPS